MYLFMKRLGIEIKIENKETVISCSIEQAIHDLAVRFLHNNPGMKIEIVKAESV